MKKPLSFFAIALACCSCTEEVSRDINTDLTQEAAQLFSLSEAIGEGSYLANISPTEYDSIISEQLPGCPAIVFSEDSTKISFDYSLALDCEEENKIARSGKIVLDFSDYDSISPTWTMRYEEYSYGGTRMEGLRIFKSLSWDENQEMFENLSVKLEKNLGFMVDGNFSYSVYRADLKPQSLSARGKIEGINPAGREFAIVTSSAKEQRFECYGFGWVLPFSGSDSWTVSRTGHSSLDYQVSFQNTDTCNPTVTAKLPDGRSLQLHP